MKPTFGRKVQNGYYQLRKGVYAIVLNDSRDHVLTVHNGRGFHFLPGGGMEKNEDAYRCLEREMLEETGYGLEVGSYIGTAYFYFISSKGEYILSDGYFYSARILEKVQEPIEEDHFLEWVLLSEMDKLFFYEHQVWAVKEAVALEE